MRYLRQAAVSLSHVLDEALLTRSFFVLYPTTPSPSTTYPLPFDVSSGRLSILTWRISITRAFLIEEATIVKRVLKAKTAPVKK